MKKNATRIDPMEELYAIRQKLSAKYGHDVWRIAEAARERMLRDEATGRRKYVRLPIARLSEPFKYPEETDAPEALCACESSPDI